MVGIKKAVVRQKKGYFPSYIHVECTLHSDGRVECYRERTGDLESSFKISKGCKLHLGTRKRDIAKGSGTTNNLLSIYSKGDYLLGKFHYDTAEQAEDWYHVLQDICDGNFKTEHEKKENVDEEKKEEDEVEKKVNKGPVFLTNKDIERKLQLANNLDWETIGVSNGLRVERECKLTKLYPCLKISCEIPGEADDIMDLIVNHPEAYDAAITKRETLKEITPHCSIEYVQRKGTDWLVRPRDAVTMRTWGCLSNGIRVVTHQSTSLVNVDPDPNFVRMKIYLSGAAITPSLDPSLKSCMVHFMLHTNMNGVLGMLPRIVVQRVILNQITFNVLTLRDIFAAKRFVQLDYDQILNEMRVQNTAINNATSISKYKSMKQIVEKQGEKAPVGEDACLTSMKSKSGSMDPSFWTETPIQQKPFMVRGKNYLNDRIKIETNHTAAKLVAVDMFETQDRVDHIASRADNFRHTYGKKANSTSSSSLPTDDGSQWSRQLTNEEVLFIVHFQVPGPPYYSLVLYFALEHEKLDPEKPFGKLLEDFVTKDDEYRHNRLKLIPRVVEGSWVVKKTVGETPAILGKKLDQRYYGDGESYVEVDVDVGSSVIARRILGVVKGYAKTLAIDLAILLEGHEESELPEVLIGSVRLIHPDLSKAVTLI